MKTQAFEHAILQAMIFEIALGFVVTVVLFWATYYVIKTGVRDGIKEAGSRSPAPQRSSAPPGFKWALVRDVATGEDMRAEK